MGFIKFLRLKMKRKSNSKRDILYHHQQDNNHDGGKTEVDEHTKMSSKVNHEDASVNQRIKTFSWGEIERLTNNFSTVIGTGGYSTVYMAHFPSGSYLRPLSLGAIKIYGGGSERLRQVFKQELDILLQLHHDHIVKFLGYCDERDEGGALVFEYVPNQNLQEKLHSDSTSGSKRKKEASLLSWRRRMAIAYQLAQAIEYLHEKCSLQIVHGDIKASNILLDEHLNCKLCDFGSAKMGFSSTVSNSPYSPSSPRSPLRMMKKQLFMMGSPGYADPHYLRTGIASKKNDVYSFGVVLLELVTGREAFSSESENQYLLTALLKPMLRDWDGDRYEWEDMEVAQMVDPRLAGKFDMEEAKLMLSISAMCLRDSPSLRPSITHILSNLDKKLSSLSGVDKK